MKWCNTPAVFFSLLCICIKGLSASDTLHVESLTSSNDRELAPLNFVMNIELSSGVSNPIVVLERFSWTDFSFQFLSDTTLNRDGPSVFSLNYQELSWTGPDPVADDTLRIKLCDSPCTTSDPGLDSSVVELRDESLRVAVTFRSTNDDPTVARPGDKVTLSVSVDSDLSNNVTLTGTVNGVKPLPTLSDSAGRIYIALNVSDFFPLEINGEVLSVTVSIVMGNVNPQPIVHLSPLLLACFHNCFLFLSVYFRKRHGRDFFFRLI